MLRVNLEVVILSAKPCPIPNTWEVYEYIRETVSSTAQSVVWEPTAPPWSALGTLACRRSRSCWEIPFPFCSQLNTYGASLTSRWCPIEALGIYATFSSRHRQNKAGKRGRYSLMARSLVTDLAARRASVCTLSRHSLMASIGAFRSEDTTPASLPRLSTSSPAHNRSVTQSTSERLAAR